MAEAKGQEAAIIAVSKRGASLGSRLQEKLDGSQLYVPARLVPGLEGVRAQFYEGSVADVLRDAFPKYRNLVLFVALGAAVRLFAPLIKDKRTDPAVVVVDELGRFAISALSGHQGGANHLARRIAGLLGAEAVITTASDALGIMSPDLIGRDFGWVIENEDNLAKVSAGLINGEPVGLFQDAGERAWWPSDRSWPENLKCFDDLTTLGQSNCAAVLIVTDRLLGQGYSELLGKSVLYRPKSLVIGIGCDRGVASSEIEHAVSSVLNETAVSLSSVRNLATIDIKGNEEGLIEYAELHGLPIEYFTANELDAVEGIPSPSEAILRIVGTRGVCEPAAMLSAGAEDLLAGKRKVGRVTVSVARTVFQDAATSDERRRPGAIFVVGLGPGAREHMTFRARDTLIASDVVVGYKTYVDLLGNLLAGKEVVSSGMRHEVARARKAVELAAAGKRVAVVSSGDAGVYGMAGLLYEVAGARGWDSTRNIEVVPGVSALSAAAALLGAPLMHDFAVISLSDLLTPWETIARRLEGAGQGDFVVALYNPRSGRRTHQVEEARRILMAPHRPGATPVGLVTSAYREAQEVVLTDLEHMLNFPVGMLTTIIIGNSGTVSFNGLMVTPRGYGTKYEL